MRLDFEHCYRATHTRDARFDGWFYVGVTSTGIYCRPSCPARTPRPENVRFFPTAAAAQATGLRACRRCQPDAVPGSPEWDLRGDVAARAMRLLRDGVVDREGVEGLATRLGYTPRHLHRVLVAELGAGPLALARTQRAHTARILLETTELSAADVAFASGFGSIRQFNDTIREVFGMPPTQVRHHVRPTSGTRRGAPGEVALRLATRLPYDAESTWRFLADRAVAGLEEVSATTYRRALRLPHGFGIATLEPAGDHVRCRLRLDDLRDLGVAVSRCRALLDLDADPQGVVEVLGDDPVLGPLVRRLHGLRVAATVDPFEVAVRAVVGQQVSVASARVVLSRIVSAYGAPLPTPVGSITRAFPTPEALATSDGLPMPARRAATIRALADAVAAGSVLLHPGADRAETHRTLVGLPGIGPWTASYIALRGLGDPDAFPETDLGLRAAIAALGVDDHPAAIRQLANGWRPLRSYAAQHLWHYLTRERSH